LVENGTWYLPNTSQNVEYVQGVVEGILYCHSVAQNRRVFAEKQLLVQQAYNYHICYGEGKFNNVLTAAGLSTLF